MCIWCAVDFQSTSLQLLIALLTLWNVRERENFMFQSTTITVKIFSSCTERSNCEYKWTIVYYTWIWILKYNYNFGLILEASLIMNQTLYVEWTVNSLMR